MGWEFSLYFLFLPTLLYFVCFSHSSFYIHFFLFVCFYLMNMTFIHLVLFHPPVLPGVLYSLLNFQIFISILSLSLEFFFLRFALHCAIFYYSRIFFILLINILIFFSKKERFLYFVKCWKFFLYPITFNMNYFSYHCVFKFSFVFNNDKIYFSRNILFAF